VEEDILLSHYPIPVGYDGFIHLLDIHERTITETNDITVVKVGVRGEEHPTAIKLKIHSLVHIFQRFIIFVYAIIGS
jgi:hypothetical protein